MKNALSKVFSPLLVVTPIVQPVVCFAQQKTERPNIIYVLVDDLRWDAMGFTGSYPFLRTPNIDKLRKEGVHFENTFCTHSLSAPSRASMLTGMFPQTNGVSTNQEGREFNPDITPSFPQILQENGYKTAFIGKWHMAESNSPRKGFDYWCSFSGQGRYYNNILNINGKEIENKNYITDELNNYALDFIEKNADKSFCLYLSHKAVHQPFTPPERDRDLYANDLVPEPAGWSDNMENKPAWQRLQPTIEQRERLRDKDLNEIKIPAKRKPGPWPANTGKGEQKNYLRCLSAVDNGLGEIYELLKKKGILDKTVIVFAGDNGYFHGEHGMGDKRLAYNESMRIPLVMRYPKFVNPGTTVSKMVLNADIAPTFLNLAGVKVPEQMQGKSIVPLLEGKNEGWRKSFLFTYWPDLIYFIPRITTIRTERYLYSQTPDIKDIDELYDEINDPAELNNLAYNPKYTDLKIQLSKELEKEKIVSGYRVEVPRPDPEPVCKIQEGKILEIDFGKQNLNDQQNIIFDNVNQIEENGKKVLNITLGSSAIIKNNKNFDPSIGTFVIECEIKSSSPNGVIASVGSEKDGWALFIENGMPGFVVSHSKHLQFVDSKTKIIGKWSHLVAVIENYNNIISLYADGVLIGKRQMLLPIENIISKVGDISIGVDAGELVDPKDISNYKFEGLIKQISFYREKMTDSKLQELSSSK